MNGLLSGFRVVESSMLLNGASVGMMLADLGADVIKVESPFLGDYLRIEETHHLHLQANKNKRSLALDLRHPAGREAMQRLIATADVFVTNARPGANEKLGLGVAQLRELKPDLVYCQYTGFGATGPYASVPTHGQMMDALAGAMPVQMAGDGLVQPNASLRRVCTLASGGEGTATGASYAAFHICAALAARARTGQGCFIDAGAAQAVVANAWVAASTLANRPAQAAYWQDEESLRGVARYQFYRAADGKYLLFCPEEKKFWATFCDAIGRPELKERHRGVDLRRELQAVFESRTREDWMDMAVALGLPIGPANDGIEEVRNDPQMRARELFVERDDPQLGRFTYIGQPVVVDGRASSVERRAPTLGEHTREILLALGYGEADLARFAAEHVTTAREFQNDHISQTVSAAGGAKP